MSIFENLLIGHLIGDFLFQTAWMADGKKKHLLPLVVHSTLYTLCVFIFSFTMDSLTLTDYLIIWVTHILIDSRKLTYWWMRNLMRISTKDDSENWITIIVDQTFHLFIFYIILL